MSPESFFRKGFMLERRPKLR